ncbi:unnamed protein product [Rotaria sp. Silwood2]|nr:unnamed protein product [Rotaria sp. Silwood2]CAF4438391.1 unnamed protein product [Rotaria sp. Silwood2]
MDPIYLTSPRNEKNNRRRLQEQPRRRRRQQQQQQPQKTHEKQIVVTVKGVKLMFRITSASPMGVQVVSPVPVTMSPVLGGVAGHLELADGGGAQVPVGGGGFAAQPVVKEEPRQPDYSQFLIDNIK